MLKNGPSDPTAPRWHQRSFIQAYRFNVESATYLVGVRVRQRMAIDTGRRRLVCLRGCVVAGKKDDKRDTLMKMNLQ